MNWNIHFEIK